MKVQYVHSGNRHRPSKKFQFSAPIQIEKKNVLLRVVWTQHFTHVLT